MSFGPSQAEKDAISNQQKIGTQATANSSLATGLGTQAINTGTNLFGTGSGNVTQGANFFNTLLNGNQDNTTALLQPNIDQIRAANQGNLQAISTLMPRGGGRSGALFANAAGVNPQIQGLFNGMRGTAAGNLATLGGQQQQAGLGMLGGGTNLFGQANSALGLGNTANQDVYGNSFNNRQYSNNMWSGLGSGLFNLAQVPFGKSGVSALGRL